jgi:hypothetical protein
MQKPPLRSHLWTLLLKTLALGGGAFTIGRVLYLSAIGKDIPSTALPVFIYVASVVSAIRLWLEERKARIALEQPEFKPGPNIQIQSATVIPAGYDSKKYVPCGSGFAAVCTLHSVEGFPGLTDVRVCIRFRKKPTGELWVEIMRGVWLNESTQSLDFVPGTSRDVVVAEWNYNQRVRAPKWSSEGFEKEDLMESAEVTYDVEVMLYTGDVSHSRHYFDLTVKPDVNTGFDRVAWSIRRN